MNPDLREQFERDGFAVIRGFFDAAEVAALEGALERFVRDVAPRVDRAHVMYEDPADPASLKQADCLHFEPVLDAYRTSGKVRQLAESLIGEVAPQHCEYFNKPPHNNKPTPPHQDGYYFCLEPNVACTLWIPLDRVDEDNGTLTYVRGSHRLGVLPHRATAVLGFSQGLIPDPANLGEAVLCPAEPGDVLVHHSLTVHSAGANRSTRNRRSIGYVYYSAAAKLDEAAHQRYQDALRSQRESKGIDHTTAATVR
ncbi:MAG: phytanoyl-CoA dioxygenase family protein [Bryobacteraceae bacterium]